MAQREDGISLERVFEVRGMRLQGAVGATRASHYAPSEVFESSVQVSSKVQRYECTSVEESERLVRRKRVVACSFSICTS